jgi:hypothetical protein
VKTLALRTLFLAVVAIGVVQIAALIMGAVPAWGPWVVALAIPVSMLAAMTLGAVRPGKPHAGLGGLALPFLVTFALIAGGFVVALLLPAENEPLLLGLPRRAAIILYGVGLLPVLVLPVAYALSFDEHTLDDSHMARLREAAKRTAAGNGGSE